MLFLCNDKMQLYIVEMDCKIYAYGMLQYHRNMTNQEAVELFKEAEELDNKIDEKTAFIYIF